MTSLYGFTLLRNGIKYDYCFTESLKSLASVSKKVFLALGESEDGTEEAVSSLEKMEVIPTVWDDSLRKGGLILSQQTNIALDALKDHCKTDPNAWGFYLQCDEVIHEEDYQLILEDVQKAHDSGADAISFRYLHFWQGHNQVAINKKWYPHEIRAVRLSSKARSWGDAQSFENVENVYYSEARIFHYGHVREEEKYLKKKKDILRLYHNDKKLPKYKRRERRFDNQTETLAYLGPHPSSMKKRMEAFGEKRPTSTEPPVYILGSSLDYSPKFILGILAKEVIWCTRLRDIPLRFWGKAVIAKPKWVHWPFNRSAVPLSMRSPLGKNWIAEDLLTFKLSEKGIFVTSR